MTNKSKKNVPIFPFLLILLLSISGCTRHVSENSSVPMRVVTEINISYKNGPVAVERSYEEQEKMQMILNYLRWIDPYGAPAEDPMTQQGADFYVELHYSDGTAKTYHQRCDRYLRVGDGPWKRIDPERARELSRLLGVLDGEGSPSAPDTSPPQPLLRPRLGCKKAVLLS